MTKKEYKIKTEIDTDFLRAISAKEFAEKAKEHIHKLYNNKIN